MGDQVQLLVPRRSTARTPEGQSVPALLSAWRDAGAYVLLAAPGGGKTEALKAEAQAAGGRYISARRFVQARQQEFAPGETIFIDGLDEMRAGSAARDSPLDAICKQLDQLGRPRFRLACREADWIGAVDAEALRFVAPGAEVTELRLEALDEADVRTLLANWPDRVPDVDAFMAQVEKQHLGALLGNPLSLRLIVAATRDGLLPASRAGIFQLACERLVSEENKAHQAAHRHDALPINALLDDAGLLFAVLLLAGAEAFSHDSATSALASDIPLLNLPHELGLRSPTMVLASPLFVADGERRLPLHRAVAEYLAAAAVARRVEGGLPIRRVLALMSGADGGIVEPLRGLHAWLAAHCREERSLLIDRDPLGVVLYGDVSDFTSSEKERVLECLGREAKRFPWFRSGNWAAHPFGALGTADMVPTFEAVMRNADRTPAHQALLDCVLDAVVHGADLHELLPALEQVVRDSSYLDHLRVAALQAWLAQARSSLQSARTWLDEILGGAITDPRDELCGLLLDALYPAAIAPADIARYFHLPKAGSFVGNYQMFWRYRLISRTPVECRPEVADGFATLRIDRSNINQDRRLPEILGAVIAAALEASGERENAHRVLGWLQAGIDSYGFAALKGTDADGVRDWLSKHPNVQKAVLAIAFSQVQPDPTTQQRHYGSGEQILYGARRPADWYQWLLELAADADSEVLAQHCFYQAAHAALDASVDFDITMEDVERWVEEQRGRWPQSHEWMEKAWSVDLDHWQADQHRRQREYRAQAMAAQERRRRDLAPYAGAVSAGAAPAGLMYQLALAYKGRYSDVHGDTPEARLQDFLGGGKDEVAGAVAGFEASLARDDLPTVAEIIESGLAQKEHYVRPACLIGAELATARSPDSPLQWSDELGSRLVAFWLTDGTGETPKWYEVLASKRPGVVADVMGAFAKQSMRKRPESSIPGLWTLAQTDEHRELARLVLPGLLQTFPVRSNEALLRKLNHELLPAAVRHLDPGVLRAVAQAKLAHKSLDAGQRIAWLVASLATDSQQRMPELLAFVGRSQTRAAQLGVALISQGERHDCLATLPPPALAALVEKLAPHCSPDWPEGASWVRDADRLRDLVRGAINRLAALPDESAGQELQRLRGLLSLKPWAMVIDAASADNRRVRRSAEFRHASAHAVAATLANGAPANASDLCALAVDRLRDMSAHIVGDEINGVRMFWRTDHEDHRTPEVENTCRDQILDKLREKLLQRSVQIEREASAANETRADLRVSAVVQGRRVLVPIEIKKEDHRQIWTAWRSQLDGSYTKDPAAEHFGIYLVLWFGHRPKSTPEGVRPRSCAELEEMLRARIPPEDRLRLPVVAVDLSWPSGP